MHSECGSYLPMSRWGHSLVARDDGMGPGSGDRVLLLGGMSSKSYCEGSVVFEFCFDQKAIANSYEEGDIKMKALHAAAKAAEAAK